MIASGARSLHQEIALGQPGAPVRLEAAAAEADGVRLAPALGAPEPLVGEGEALYDAVSVDVGPDGAIWVADAAAHRILRIDPCGGPARPLRCLTGPGSEPGRVNGPRGLAVGPRGALYVADTGNHRVQVVDLDTATLRDIWPPVDPYAPPRPRPGAGEFDEPTDLAADDEEALYVADSGNGRVQKLDTEGRPDAGFATAWAAQPDPPQRPLALVTIPLGDEELLVVLGEDASGELALWAHALDGTLDQERTGLWRAGLAARGVSPGAVAVVPGSGELVVADLASPGRLVLVDDAGRVRRGPACAFPPSGAAGGGGGVLVVGGGSVQRLEAGAARERAGHLLVGPLVAEPAAVQEERLTRWQRVRLEADGLGERTALGLATCTMLKAGDPPPLPVGPAVAPGTELAPAGEWRRAAAGALDVLALNEPAPFLWVAVELRGDGAATPVARHLSVRYDHEGWVRHLPAVYSVDPAGRELLDRLLGGLEAALDDEEALVDGLPALFDPNSAPDGPLSPWLDWLAGWVAVELDASDTPQRRRSTVAEAFTRHARRGTLSGLRELLQLELDGAPVAIEEPGVEARLWQLGSVGLGFGTRLAPAEADGAVLDTTAVLDRSHLLGEQRHGLPLFADLAHCIVVHVPPCPEDELKQLRRLVEDEKPAHVVAHVCPIRPLARLGFQSTVGVDAVVAAGSEPLALGGRAALGEGARLGEEDRLGIGGTIGARARLGSSTLVT